ncbi:MAG: ACT domain-containing protein [archaeon]|nr:ACT domain-containing protein [archaeon]
MINNNGYSLSEAVRKEIESQPHIKNSLSEGVINYSALARKIIPELEITLEKEIHEESVIVAIKRYADEMKPIENEATYIETFANSEVMLQDDMCYVHFKKNPEVIKKIDKLFSSEDWKMGEMRVLIQGADQIMVITKKKRIKEILEELRDDVIYSIEDNALVSFRMPFESFSTYGILAEMSNRLAKKGINIEVLTSPPDVHFLVDEKDAEKTYGLFKKLINDSKELYEKQKK